MTRSEKRRLKKKSVVLEILAAGGSVASACSVASIARCTFYDWQEKDEWFDDGVMAIRRELMLESLGELQAQAYGRYVDEVTVRETDQGVVTTRRHRFLNGKLSALVRLQENAMDDGGPAGDRPETGDVMVETGEPGVVSAEPVTRDADVSDFEAKAGTVAADRKEPKVSGFEANSGDAGGRPEAGDVLVETGGAEGGSVDPVRSAAEVSDFEAKSMTVAAENDVGAVAGGELPAEGIAPSPSAGGSAGRMRGVAGGDAALRKARKAKRKQANDSRRKNRRR